MSWTAPPNWPPPPAGWAPTPGWQPDPAWGPAPPGWLFWQGEYAPDPAFWGRAADRQASHGGAGIVAVVGAGVVAVGSLLPWATIDTAFGSVSKSGTSGDGVITLLLAVATGVMMAVATWGNSRGRVLPGLSALGGLVVTAIAAADLADVSNRVADVNNVAGSFASASVGGGLVLTLVGGMVAFVACVVVSAKDGA